MITRCPRRSPVTSAPVDSTVPATSQPLTWGKPSGGGKRPSSRSMSTWFSAHAEGERRRGIDADQDVVESLVAPEDDLELVHVGVGPHQLLHPARVDDHAADLLHVVEPRQHTALEGDQRAPARAPPVGDLDDVARAIAKEWHRFAVEAREDQLAALPGADRSVLLVEHLGIAVV